MKRWIHASTQTQFSNIIFNENSYDKIDLDDADVVARLDKINDILKSRNCKVEVSRALLKYPDSHNPGHSWYFEFMASILSTSEYSGMLSKKSRSYVVYDEWGCFLPSPGYMYVDPYENRPYEENIDTSIEQYNDTCAILIETVENIDSIEETVDDAISKFSEAFDHTVQNIDVAYEIVCKHYDYMTDCIGAFNAEDLIKNGGPRVTLRFFSEGRELYADTVKFNELNNTKELVAKFSEEVTYSQLKSPVRYVKSLLKNNNIDLTKHKYQLKAQQYLRMSEGEKYQIEFTCPGDYLAYFSMLLHEQPTLQNILAEYGISDLVKLINANPSVESIAEYASYNWWGDGDDYIYKLTNLDTGKVLYSSR